MKRFFILFALTSCAVAQAQTLFSTLGPNDSYIENTGRSITGAQNVITQSYGEWGWQFTALESGPVVLIKVGAHHLLGTNSVAVKISTNGPGDTVGTQLASYSLVNLPEFNTQESIRSIYIQNPTVNLVAGNTYWIGMAPTHGDTFAAWMDSDQGMFGRMSVSGDGTNFSYVNNMPYSAFSISSVPEMSSTTSMTLMSIGFAGLTAKRRKKSST